MATEILLRISRNANADSIPVIAFYQLPEDDI